MSKITILLLSLVLYFIQVDKEDYKVFNCKIIATDKNNRTIECPDFEITNFSMTRTIEISAAKWPEEWNDSTKVDDIVKVKVSSGKVIPFLSCEAREKLMKEKLSKRKTEFKLPLQLPLDKDCQ